MFLVTVSLRFPFLSDFLETVATLPGDLGLIPIAEALKSATSRTGVSRTSSHEVQSHIPPVFLGRDHEMAPVTLLQSHFLRVIDSLKIATSLLTPAANKGDVLNCRGKMPSLLRGGLPGLFNLPKELRLSRSAHPECPLCPPIAHLGDLPRQHQPAGPAAQPRSPQPSSARKRKPEVPAGESIIDVTDKIERPFILIG